MRPDVEELDPNKRYDIYARHSEDRLLIYRNVRFRGTRALPGRSDPFDRIGHFILIEQDDGTELLISEFTYFCICEHGTRPAFEVKWVDEMRD